MRAQGFAVPVKLSPGFAGSGVPLSGPVVVDVKCTVTVVEAVALPAVATTLVLPPCIVELVNSALVKLPTPTSATDRNT